MFDFHIFTTWIEKKLSTHSAEVPSRAETIANTSRSVSSSDDSTQQLDDFLEEERRSEAFFNRNRGISDPNNPELFRSIFAREGFEQGDITNTMQSAIQLKP